MYTYVYLKRVGGLHILYIYMSIYCVCSIYIYILIYIYIYIHYNPLPPNGGGRGGPTCCIFHCLHIWTQRWAENPTDFRNRPKLL